MTEPEPRRELDGQLSMPIASSGYNRRSHYPATECAGTSVEGDGVRAAARPSPTDSAIELGDGWRALVFVKDGKLRVSLIPRIGVAAHLNLDPAAARRLGSAIVARADLAQLPEAL